MQNLKLGELDVGYVHAVSGPGYNVPVVCVY